MKPRKALRIDLDVSSSVREKVWGATSKYPGAHKSRAEGLTYEGWFNAIKDVLDAYYAEKGRPKGIEQHQVLSLLFQEVTGNPTRGKKGQPEWGVPRFNYTLLIGLDKELAPFVWAVVDGGPRLAQASIRQFISLINTAAKRRKLPRAEIWQEAMTFVDLSKASLWSRDWKSEVLRKLGAPTDIHERRPRVTLNYRGLSEHQRTLLSNVFIAVDEFCNDVRDGVDDLAFAPDVTLDVDVALRSFHSSILNEKNQLTKAARSQALDAAREIGVTPLPDGSFDLVDTIKKATRIAADNHPDRKPNDKFAKDKFSRAISARARIEKYLHLTQKK